MTDEVRLKGFRQRTALSEVAQWIQARVEPLGVERVSFREAAGRVLAEDVVALQNVPRYPRAAMDGYAVRAADVPGTLRVREELTAAQRASDPLAPKEAIRIMTGARLPDGADAVVMIEHTKTEADRVVIEGSTEPGKHILRVGEDVEAGLTVLTTGRWLRSPDIALLVQVGVTEVVVRRRPTVVIVPTGSELLRVGQPVSGTQVVETNSFMLEQLARRDGAEPVLHPIVQDDLSVLTQVMTDCRADLLVVTGGSSIGREDFAPVVANDVGEVAFHGVAVKPGSSTGIGRIGKTWVVLGPGYPVAAYVAWDLIVRPMVLRLLGASDRWPYRSTVARMDEPYPKRAGRTEIVRVTLSATTEPTPRATALPGGAAILTTLTRADGFLCLPDGQGPLERGDEVNVFLFD